jgi:hypothetical protein
MPLVLQIVLGNEIQGLLCLLKVSMESPENLRELHFLNGIGSVREMSTQVRCA